MVSYVKYEERSKRNDEEKNVEVIGDNLKKGDYLLQKNLKSLTNFLKALDPSKIPVNEEIEGHKVLEVLDYLKNDHKMTKLEIKSIEDSKVCSQSLDKEAMYSFVKEAFYFNEKTALKAWLHHYIIAFLKT